MKSMTIKLTEADNRRVEEIRGLLSGRVFGAKVGLTEIFRLALTALQEKLTSTAE